MIKQENKKVSMELLDPDLKLLQLPNKENASLRYIKGIYKDVQKIPTIVSSSILSKQNNLLHFSVTWSVNDTDNQEAIQYSKKYFATLNETNDEIKKVCEIPRSWTLSSSNTSVFYSSDNKHKIVIRKSKINNKTTQYIDVWENNKLIKSIDIEATGKHGTIYLNSRFGPAVFSPDGNKVAYVAEQKIKTESYFKDDNTVGKTFESFCEEYKVAGNEYNYRQDWGESFEGTIHTCICILTIKPELSLKVIELPSLSLTQPFWIDDDSIGYLAFEESPKRLGLIYCNNRVSYLYKTILNKEEDANYLLHGLGSNLHLNNPRINAARNKVVFFENPAGGPHVQASAVMILHLDDPCKVDVVYNDLEINGPVKSLCLLTVPDRCWTSDDEHIILHSVYHSKQILCVLNIVDKKLTILDFPLTEATLQEQKYNYMIVSGSSPADTPTFYLAKFQNDFDKIKFIAPDEREYPRLDDIQYKISEINEGDPLDQIETILVGPKDSFNTPQAAIVIPHGGPHSAYTSSFMKTITIFVRLGFKVLLVNYRGSLGFTRDYIHQLCGNVGSMDVKDVIQAIEFEAKNGFVDKNCLILYGGSHGGFLVSHLIGQYPKYNFKCCIAINPVIDISKMFCVSDIPDWCLIEALGSDIEIYKKINNWPEESNLINQLNRIIDVGNADILKTMFEKSPMNHVNDVKTPVLMLLGKEDKRVPHFQGLSFVNALKVRGIETKCMLYDDKHDLGKLNNNGDHVIHSIYWILDHIN